MLSRKGPSWMSTALLSLDAPTWHEPLLAFLPLIRSTAAKAYRHLPVAERDEAVAEVVADSTSEFARLAARGRPHFWLIPALAKFAVRKRNAGRRVGTKVSRNDVLSPVPRKDANVESLESLSRSDVSAWRQAVADSRRTDPAEAAIFRIDFSRWLEGLPGRHREVVLALAEGERPGELANRLGIRPARVSQLRTELRAAWAVFQGEAEEHPTTATAAA